MLVSTKILMTRLLLMQQESSFAVGILPAWAVEDGS
jgi:hypothetical protein